MSESRRHLASLCASLLFLPVAVHAVPIAWALDEIDPNTGSGGGFWLGAIDFGPEDMDAGADGLNRFTVAQSFQAHRDYANVTGAVMLAPMGELANIAEQPSSVLFSLATDSAGTPGGTTLATFEVLLASTGPQLYTLGFSNVSLLDDQTYWLIASSQDVWVTYQSEDCCSGAIPSWYSAQRPYAGPMAYSQNAAPWVVLEQSMQFAMFGDELGDPIANGEPRNVPEPSTAALLLMALLAVGYSARRKVAISASISRTR